MVTSDDIDDLMIMASISLKGWTKYYKGKITRENRENDILFEFIKSRCKTNQTNRKR